MFHNNEWYRKSTKQKYQAKVHILINVNNFISGNGTSNKYEVEGDYNC